MAILHVLRVKRSGADVERSRDDEGIEDGISVSLRDAQGSLMCLDRKWQEFRAKEAQYGKGASNLFPGLVKLAPRDGDELIEDLNR